MKDYRNSHKHQSKKKRTWTTPETKTDDSPLNCRVYFI